MVQDVGGKLPSSMASTCTFCGLGGGGKGVGGGGKGVGGGGKGVGGGGKGVGGGWEVEG